MRIDPDWKSSSKIIPCMTCKGTGVVEQTECTSYHNSDYDYWNELCTRCDGDGRLVQVDYAFRVEFSTPNSLYSFPNAHQDYYHSTVEKLDGRTTSDIYKLGRR
jgi:hypothetical protein